MDEMATPAQVAEVLHTTEASLAQMRYRGDGPVFARVGRRRVLYRWCDVKKWIEDSLHVRTDQVLDGNKELSVRAAGFRERPPDNRLCHRKPDGDG